MLQASYCNVGCQKAHWRAHKSDCRQAQLKVELQQAEHQVLQELGLPIPEEQQQDGEGAAAVPADDSFVPVVLTEAELLRTAVLKPEQVGLYVAGCREQQGALWRLLRS